MNRTLIAQQRKTTCSIPLTSGMLQRKDARGTRTLGRSGCAGYSNPPLSLQRYETNQSNQLDIPQVVYDVLSLSGNSLCESTRGFMGQRFGHGFAQTPAQSLVSHHLQTNLTVNEPGDKYEQEADHVADQVIQMSDVNDVNDVTSDSQYDFSKVRIHTDNRAADAARTLGAEAFTVGNHVVFGTGKYQPNSVSGKRLLAHELTHVVQQTGSSENSVAQRSLVKHRTITPQVQGRWNLDQSRSNSRLEIAHIRGNGRVIHSTFGEDSATEGGVFGLAEAWQTWGLTQAEVGGQAQVSKWVTKHMVFRNDGLSNDFLQLTTTGQLGGNAKAEDLSHARAGAAVWGAIIERTAADPTPSGTELFSPVSDGGISTATLGDLGEIEADIGLGEFGSARIRIPLKRVQQGALSTFSDSRNGLRDVSSSIDEVDVFLTARIEADADIESSLFGLNPLLSPDVNLAQVNAAFNVNWQNRPNPQRRRPGSDIGSATASSGRDSAPMDLHAFGNTSRPRDPRRGRDIQPDGDDYVGPTSPPTGASTFGDVDHAPLTGHYHQISNGTSMTQGLNVIADGSDVGGSQPPTHHTIFPRVRMLFDDFVSKFQRLPWVYDGRKR